MMIDDDEADEQLQHWNGETYWCISIVGKSFWKMRQSDWQTELMIYISVYGLKAQTGLYFCSTRKRFTLLLLFLQHKDFIPGTQTKQHQWRLWLFALCVKSPKETDLLQICIEMFCVLVEIDSPKCLLSMNYIFVHSQGSSCPENILNLKS